jgi:hypothetical protein
LNAVWLGGGFGWHTWAQPRPQLSPTGDTIHVDGVSGDFLKGIGFHRLKDRIIVLVSE